MHKGPPIIPIQCRNKPVPDIDNYLFKFHYNVVLSSRSKYLGCDITYDYHKDINILKNLWLTAPKGVTSGLCTTG